MHFLAVRNIMAVEMSVLLCLLLWICTEKVEIPKNWVQQLLTVCSEISRRNFGITIILETSHLSMRYQISTWVFVSTHEKKKHQHVHIEFFHQLITHSCNHCFIIRSSTHGLKDFGLIRMRWSVTFLYYLFYIFGAVRNARFLYGESMVHFITCVTSRVDAK